MKYTEKNVPENLRVQVHHQAQPDYARARYATICLLRDRETNEVMASATAICSLKDQPLRKIGRAIAVGRALKQYREKQDPFLEG